MPGGCISLLWDCGSLEIGGLLTLGILTPRAVGRLLRQCLKEALAAKAWVNAEWEREMKPPMIEFPKTIPPGLMGIMVSLNTWLKLIEESEGSAIMKSRIVYFIGLNVPPEPGPTPDMPLLDSFKLGYAMGEFSADMMGDELADFRRTVLPTRDMDKLPIVQRYGKPVS